MYLVKGVAAIGLALLLVPQAMAADTVPSKSMAEIVTDDPRDCRFTSTIKLPTITWGADIVTLHAVENGFFEAEGLDVEIERVDDFGEQLRSYLRCDTPFLRGTAGMAAMASAVTETNDDTALMLTHQLSWSVGGDALVGSNTVQRVSDICGKRIALQRHGPHVDYALRVIADAGCSDAPTLVFTQDLTGGGDSTPAAALRDGDAEAAFVILPDALTLTLGGTTGNGAEGSVNGAEIIMSTKTASRVIADAYFVRSDFFYENEETVKSFVRAWMKAEQDVRRLVGAENDAYRTLFSQAADFFLDLPGEHEEARLLFNDMELVGVAGNSEFVDRVQPRSFHRIVPAIMDQLRAEGIIQRPRTLLTPSWTVADVMGTEGVAEDRQERFDEREVRSIVADRAKRGTIDDSTLFEFVIRFEPQGQNFPIDLYRGDFERVIELSATYGGAIVVIEGHVDPNMYLRQKNNGASPAVLRQQIQASKSLSGQRATAARSAILDYADGQGILLHDSQFDILARGHADPIQGTDSSGEPLPTPNEATWKQNMRVEVKLINVEAEAEAFQPLSYMPTTQ